MKYLCWDCINTLKATCKIKINTHVQAVNEVGRKFCDRCEGNENNLYVYNDDEFNEIINSTHELACNVCGQTSGGYENDRCSCQEGILVKRIIKNNNVEETNE